MLQPFRQTVATPEAQRAAYEMFCASRGFEVPPRDGSYAKRLAESFAAAAGFLVAEEGGLPIVLAQYHLTEKVGHIDTLAVAEGARGRGFGSEALSLLVDVAASQRARLVQANSLPGVAEGFYATHGFNAGERYPDFVVMKKSLVRSQRAA